MIDFLKEIYMQVQSCNEDLLTHDDRSALLNLGMLEERIRLQIELQEGLG